MDFQDLREIKTDSQEIFDGVILHVFKDTVKLPNGKSATREVIRHIGAVGVIPITDDGKVIIEKQFRYPLNRIVTEIPAGKLDSFTEDRLSAAKRELEEETGYTAAEWIPLGDYIPTCAYCDERITLYMAKGLQLGQRHLDEDEFLNFEAVPLEKLVEQVMNGTITDGKTQVAILKAARYLEK
jgi:ADP-ribose pyrophosphatase